MNYIITGGTGFIGTHLTNLLNEVHPEAKVWNLDIVKPGTPNPVVKNYKPAVKEGEKLGSTYIECDVRKPIVNLPFEPTPEDVVFNFAAVHRTPGHEDREYFETNIRGAENVCAFAEKYGIKNMVFTSSIAPYGASEELKTEDTLPTPNTAYGISKLVAEKIHLAWQKGGNCHTDPTDLTDGQTTPPNGTPPNLGGERRLLIVRPGVVFGKGENGNSIIMPMAACAKMVGSPMGICPARVRKLQISTNICGKRMAESGYKFKYTFEEALADWYADNKGLYLE